MTCQKRSRRDHPGYLSKADAQKSQIKYYMGLDSQHHLEIDLFETGNTIAVLGIWDYIFGNSRGPYISKRSLGQLE